MSSGAAAVPERGSDPPRSLLTPEERRALLGSDDGSREGARGALLFLPRSDEEVLAAAFLGKRGYEVVAASNAYGALDLVRAGAFWIFLCDPGALPCAPSWYVSRLRSADPGVEVVWVRDAAAVLPPPGRVLRRPMSEDDLALLWAGLGSAVGMEGRGPWEAGEEGPPKAARVPEPETRFPGIPDPASEVASLLEPRADGGRGRSALESRQRLDPEGSRFNTSPSRERFRAFLDSRMRAARRRKGRLGLLAFRAAAADSPEQLCRALRSALRGGDWVERLGDDVYAVLEEPGRSPLGSVGRRLRDLPGVDRAVVAALGWDPAEDAAARLLDRAERILSGEGPGEARRGASGRR